MLRPDALKVTLDVIITGPDFHVFWAGALIWARSKPTSTGCLPIVSKTTHSRLFTWTIEGRLVIEFARIRCQDSNP